MYLRSESRIFCDSSRTKLLHVFGGRIPSAARPASSSEEQNPNSVSTEFAVLVKSSSSGSSASCKRTPRSGHTCSGTRCTAHLHIGQCEGLRQVYFKAFALTMVLSKAFPSNSTIEPIRANCNGLNAVMFPSSLKEGYLHVAYFSTFFRQDLDPRVVLFVRRMALSSLSTCRYR